MVNVNYFVPKILIGLVFPTLSKVLNANDISNLITNLFKKTAFNI